MTNAQLKIETPVAVEGAAVASAGVPSLEFKGVTKSYGTGAQRSVVLDNINLQIKEGEFVAIVGFSGSGKSTLISLIAGLQQVDSGQVLRNGKPIEGPGPDRGVVFQNYSLMPWMTVRQNVALSVDQAFQSASKEERNARVEKYIAMVNLTPAMDKRPSELSGGMRQRVSVARALAASPDILLLDEPLSALDALTRSKLQDEIIRIWSQEKKTVVLITNDVDEGIIMADRIIPLNPGPNATLGPEFIVTLPRPRDRAAINHSPEFKRIRREVTQYLMQVGAEKNAAVESNVVTLPSVLPNTSREHQENRKQGAVVPPNVERYVDFSQVSKIYPSRKGPIKVVDGFDLKIRKGEFISVIGHSGCGKSTVLSMMAGLSDISEGVIVLDGREIDAAGPDRGIVFQAPSLVPWLSAYENVAMGVEQVFPHASKQERKDIAENYLSRVGLADVWNKKASELSNGMKQRVGIARAFALSPKMLLLDEPFGMLDSLTRWDLQEVLMEVWTRTKVTAMMVTHDVDEAILLADRVVMMTNGPNAKVGKILEINLPRPRTRKMLLEHPDYYALREQLLTFLAECDHG
ncbi:MAG: nitrate/sulfonate/bicarbonate ABC transporter ATP-binding protein [Gallionellales bacterium 35-53-114]|jgi:nitrate/nitrite transport system ATP-binding protein|nr:MAG: nitrate/sulfonate/bicarbonate ABC transporter ATP-binding protein [Gallionellales bacterium 35-53-114]OYZ62603.1 MAG: nitrate/sulfonate/bicarbonate ABC transporter ATP-binding protein [Gallionellales bacterium 24-53-125]OZB09677.1 MAG: nitrate/sulfonate/bicarbonate ABC transporter ATP-binding protein [Gallionellales bacterium 39-52-133]HQS57766.1 ABC transporter ATP-binding protein [Gallionellaceae bacterium]HQS74219.1 ABC transporter ATP-binding protein [Gallionellaceae bacterium]